MKIIAPFTKIAPGVAEALDATGWPWEAISVAGDDEAYFLSLIHIYPKLRSGPLILPRAVHSNQCPHNASPLPPDIPTSQAEIKQANDMRSSQKLTPRAEIRGAGRSAPASPTFLRFAHLGGTLVLGEFQNLGVVFRGSRVGGLG